MESEETRDAAWGEGRPKDVLESSSAGAALRALRGGRQGFASGTDFSPEGLRRLWKAAQEAAELSPEDAHRHLPAARKARTVRAGKRESAPSTGELLKRLKKMEAQILGFDQRLQKALTLSFHETRGQRAVASTRGVDVAEPYTAASFGVELLGEQDGEPQSAWGSADRARWRDLPVDPIWRDACRRLVDSFGAAPLPTGLWTVVFEPRVGTEFLELFAQASAADAVQRGRSFLAGRKGDQVGSKAVTIVDDARLPFGLGTSRWDAEGSPTGRTTLVARGALRQYLYDAETSRRDRVPNTGNASRAGISGPPSPGPSNFFLARGAMSRRRLLETTPRAFLVRDVIGMHTADTVSGDFSVGAAGVLWEGGAVRRAVKGVTLAGNLLDLWKKVDAVADDLTWQGGFGAPTFRVPRMAVGGA